MTLKHGVLIIAGLGVIGIGYYALSPLFRNVTLDEPVPTDVLNHTEEDTKLPEKQTEKINEVLSSEMSEEMPEQGKEILTYPVLGTRGHPASGEVRVLETSDGTVIRYENFSTINGPDLHVYLAKDIDAKDFIDLGPIRGTRGNINYEVPKDVTVSEYRYVMYWCVPFGVLFNYAEIQ